MGSIKGAIGPVLLRFLLAAAVLLGVGAAIGAALGSTFVPDANSHRPDPHLVQPGTPKASATPSAKDQKSAPPATGAAGRPIAVPQTGSGSGAFVVAAASGPVHGGAGRLHRYRVEIEGGTGQDPTEVAVI